MSSTDFLAAASAGVEAGISYARERSMKVAVVTLDSTMTVSSAQRMDHSYPSAFEVARAKAVTAFNFGAPTGALAERIVPENQAALRSVMPQLMFVAGGVPVRVDDRVVGAVGVSGGSADQDAEIAQAAQAAFESALAR